MSTKMPGLHRTRQPHPAPGRRRLRPRRPPTLRPYPATVPGREPAPPGRPAAVRVRQPDRRPVHDPHRAHHPAGRPRRSRRRTPRRPAARRPGRREPAPPPNGCTPPHTRHRLPSRARPSALTPPPSSPGSRSLRQRHDQQQHSPVRPRADHHCDGHHHPSRVALLADAAGAAQHQICGFQRPNAAGRPRRHLAVPGEHLLPHALPLRRLRHVHAAADTPGVTDSSWPMATSGSCHVR